MSENFIVILICPTWMPCSLCQFAGRALVEPAPSLFSLVWCIVAALWLVRVVPSVNIFAELHLNLINWHLKLTFLWSFNRIQLNHSHIYLWKMKIITFHYKSDNFIKYFPFLWNNLLFQRCPLLEMIFKHRKQTYQNVKTWPTYNFS